MRNFIPIAEPDLTGHERAYLNECIDTGWISYRGPFVKKLAEQFADYIGVEYAIPVCNGTAALHLSLLALGIGPGDEVIVPTLTFVATANAVKYVGATPVFVDSQYQTGNLDPSKIEAKITDKTKAIIPVHLYGQPCQMDEIMAIAQKHQLKVVEDAAEAHGAEYKGQKVGSFGDLATFSFFANKVITAGEGGIVTTNSKELADRVVMFRDQGLSPQDREKYHYWHPVIGYNYGLSNLQAAVAVAQLERLDQFIAIKRRNAQRYIQKLSSCDKLELLEEQPETKTIYWMFSVLVKKEAGLDRDQLMVKLKEKGIDSRPFFYPIHSLPPYDTKEVIPVAQDLAARGLNLPSGVTLTLEEVDYICKTLIQCLS